MSQQLYVNTLPESTATLVKILHTKRLGFLEGFYLSGGTALSLQLGHRESEDLDFFNPESFDPEKLQVGLMALGQLEQTELAQGTLNTFLQGVKLQFLHYPYTLLEPLIDWETIRLSSVVDIACTKLQTIGMRGSKKDFIDLYFLLERYSLPELLVLMEQKYSQVNYSQTHIMKSLVYFDDAEQQPMPRMQRELNWDGVKVKIVEAVKAVRF